MTKPFLLSYLVVGPTFKDRIVDNIFKYPILQQVDVLILTDDVLYEGFAPIKNMSNIIFQNIYDHLNEYPQFIELEKIPEEKIDQLLYKQQIEQIINTTRFSLNLQRFVLNYAHIDEYEFVSIADVDTVPVCTPEEFDQMVQHLRDNMQYNGVASNKILYNFSDGPNMQQFVDEYEKTHQVTIQNRQDIRGFDNPIKIFRFVSPSTRQQMFYTWNNIMYLAFDKKFHMNSVLYGSWNILTEPVLALAYSLCNMYLHTEEHMYRALNVFRTLTFPEDRFWDGIGGMEFDTSVGSKEQFINKNKELLKLFYERQGQEFTYE